MSKFTKCGLALAVAGALVLPATAFAATATYAPGTHATFASNLFNANTNTVANPATYTITTVAADNIIGRTTGFGVRLTLGGGAQFSSLAAPTAGTALTGYTIGAPVGTGAVRVIPVSADPAADPAPNITVGSLLNFGAGSMVLTNLSSLANGGSVPLTIELFDSNTAQVFQTINGQAVLTAQEGVTVTFDASAGDVQKRIDVAACGTDSAAKTRFSGNGEVGFSCVNGFESGFINLGRIDVGTTQVTVGNAPQYVLASGFAGANNSGGIFAIAQNDEVDYTVTGADLSAFEDNAFLSTDSQCFDRTVALTVNAAGTSATGTRVRPNTTPVAEQMYVCLAADTDQVIAQQAISASVSVDFASTAVRDPAASVGNLLPLRYNGTVLQFQNVNPAANARAQSFVRLTNNNTSLACPVTLEGRDDNGVAGDSAISFTIAPGASMTFNSEDLENGSAKGTGAFGDGAGRWVVTANAECTNFVGSALNRNLENGTVTNLTSDKRADEIQFNPNL